MKFYINRSQFVQRTKKELDGNNYLVAYDVPIAKTGIQKYSREELGDTEGHPDEMLNVYRSQDVFQDNDELLETFDGIPIVYQHPDNGRVDNVNFKHFVVGTVSGVYYKDGSLYAKKLTIIDKEAIENILRKKTNELSIGFKGKVVKKSGKFNGENYQYKEDVIHANHLALCENGKAGSFYAINSKKGKDKMTVFSANSVEQEHERMRDCIMNTTTQEPTFSLEGIIDQAVKKQMAHVRPQLLNESLEEEEEKKLKSMENDDEDMMDESEAEEDAEDEDEEGEKELKKKKKKLMSLKDSEEEMEEKDKKDREIVNALKKSNEKLRSLINSKNKVIKNLELRKISLESDLDEAKELMQSMANRFKQTNLTNSMTAPDNFLKNQEIRENDFCRTITSSFLYSSKK